MIILEDSGVFFYIAYTEIFEEVKDMIKCFNDIHGNAYLMKCLKDLRVDEGDIIVANGDFLGNRGPILNEVVNVFYGVRRKEKSKEELEAIIAKRLKQPDQSVIIEADLISNAVHSGTFLAEMRRRYIGFRKIVENEAEANLNKLPQIAKLIQDQGGKLIYLPGNGEIAISDFDVDEGVESEKTLPPKKRLFNQLSNAGEFSNHGVEYVNRPTVINRDTLLVPIDSLDEKTTIKDTENIVNLVVHHPPTSLIIEDCFYKLFGYKPNDMDRKRSDAVSEIVNTLPNLKRVLFGHIHLDIKKETIEKLPTSIFFRNENIQLIWNAPGNVYAIN